MYTPVDYPEIRCKRCDRFFKPNRKDKIFCSRTCQKKYGKIKYGHSNGKNARNLIYTKYKKEYCEECGFEPKHPCQLDVDHVDGDKNNNSIDNLKTLCANCHRLKTALQLKWH